VFGDPQGYLVGIRKEFAFVASDQFKLDYLRTYFRGVGRARGVLRSADAFCLLKTAAQ
jgi:hypothetical protein